jgi:hypothetical protein
MDKNMALPIKETPIFTGKDAARFLKNMREAKTHIPTPKEIEDYIRARKIYEEMKARELLKKAKAKDFNHRLFI